MSISAILERINAGATMVLIGEDHLSHQGTNILLSLTTQLQAQGYKTNIFYEFLPIRYKTKESGLVTFFWQSLGFKHEAQKFESISAKSPDISRVIFPESRAILQKLAEMKNVRVFGAELPRDVKLADNNFSTIHEFMTFMEKEFPDLKNDLTEFIDNGQYNINKSNRDYFWGHVTDLYKNSNKRIVDFNDTVAAMLRHHHANSNNTINIFSTISLLFILSIV